MLWQIDVFAELFARLSTNAETSDGAAVLISKSPPK
jgi:hypothetical protein